MGKKYLKRFVKAKITADFAWLEISKEIIKNTNKKLHLVTGCIHDQSSKYYDPNVFDRLSVEITKVCDENTPLIITGDLNGRTGVVDDKYEENYSTDFEIRPATSIPLPLRKNCDTTINQQGGQFWNCDIPLI